MKSYFDIVGDGGSGVARQAAELRSRIDARLDGIRNRLAIGSGKGGVGKSTLTIQLAAALRERSLAVGVLDADVNGPAQARMAGLPPMPPLPGPDGLRVPRTRSGVPVLSLGSVFAEPQAVYFDSVAHGESQTWRATREFSALAELLAAAEWGKLDLLLIDLPPGAERTEQFADFLGASTAFVLVTIPSALSRGVVRRAVSALAGRPNRLLGYVENMCGYSCPGCGTVRPLFPSTDGTELEVPCLGRIPFDPQVAALCDRGEFGGQRPSTACAGAVEDLAERLMGELEADR